MNGPALINSQHLSAIVRMQWQIRRNQFRRSTHGNRILTYILVALAVLGSLSSFILSLFLGSFFLAKAGPIQMMYVWDVLAGLFLLAWATGVMIELQRSEMLSLKNLLHLPVSLSGAFLLNYISSLLSLTVLLFLPGMLGLCFASVLHFGVGSLVVFALLLSFLFMVTAVSYQLRGWLARLMESKRTRGTVIAITTTFFILVFQIPNFINMKNVGSRKAERSLQREAHDAQVADLNSKFEAGEIPPDEFVSAMKSASEGFAQQRTSARDSRAAATNRAVKFANLWLPVGWLPYGASAAAGGSILSPCVCALGMLMIGLASLSMAYRSTVRVYTGSQNKTPRSTKRRSSAAPATGSLLEKSIPLLSAPQSVVAFATLRSTLRAPEAKLALITPLIFTCVFGSMLLTGPFSKVPEFARPFLGVGTIYLSLFGTCQLMLNIFGLDRQGFRAYVLTPVQRCDILLGKNMGVLPIVLVLSVPLVVFAGIVAKLPFSHVVASILQVIVAYALFFPIGNLTSISAPIGMASGTMKPASMNFSLIAKQFLAMLSVSLTTLPAIFAIAAESLAVYLNVAAGYPIYLLLTLFELPLAVWFYRKMIAMQGPYLQRREQDILEVISKVAD